MSSPELLYSVPLEILKMVQLVAYWSDTGKTLTDSALCAPVPQAQSLHH